ncbi:MAG: multiheme c-type cytochrome [Planctomycetota bacterium]
MTTPDHPSTPPIRKAPRPAVGPRLKKLLSLVFALAALLAVNAVYLASVTFLGWATGSSYENWFYLTMFLMHLALGLLLVAPVLVFAVLHMRATFRRKNRRAVRAGLALFGTVLLLLASGIVLMRLEGIIVVKNPTVRSIAYWAHVLTPLGAAWLFVLHRLAGPAIRWKIALRWAGVAAAFAGLMLILQAQDPRKWNVAGNPDGDKYFFPSLARTVSGDFIPSRVLMNDAYCQKCHSDPHESWSRSVHRFSSFNNPPYLAAVRETREVMLQRDGNVKGSRFCAGCHDPVPFFSGAFNDPDYDLENDPTAQAGITCTTCHSITHINSPRGNGDYTIEEPIHYPFAFSENPALRWVNEQLVKAKPEFHRKTFLKPLHRTTEFCGACHKVHLPEELNHYKWLRGQNHYDSFLLSGVSGFGVSSFYYPKRAEANCNGCHMPLVPSEDFAARVRDESGRRMTFDHMFPSANTAVPTLAGELGRLTPEEVARTVAAHQRFLEGVMRVDLFGVKQGGTIQGELLAPLRPEVPPLERGASYLLETVVRTLKMGHLLTEGTADSNEIWLEVTVTSGGRVIGRSGACRASDNAVDPWSHFLNAFVLDRNGNRINRRNAQDIFIPLYNHQIPPGAADVVHYLLHVPEHVTAPITVDVKLQYRKFDTEYLQFVKQDPTYINAMPITTLAQDCVTFPVVGLDTTPANGEVTIPAWERWNDYGIGLLRKLAAGELRQAEHAFQQVEALGRPDGPLNLARVYLREGRIASEAPEALRRARDFDPPANEWSVLWFSGLVNKQNGRLDEAIHTFRQIVEGGFEQAKGRGFDFSRDWRVLIELGNTLYDRAKQERGEARSARCESLLREAAIWLEKALELEPEEASAHYNLAQVYTRLGKRDKAERHAALHAKYKPDDNARDRAVALARMNYPAANHAAEAVVIYNLQREEAYGLD